MIENSLQKDKKVALFIDCENISYKLIDEIMEKLSLIGEVCIKKAYGYWRDDSLKNWENELKKYSIEPIHVITGKNSSTSIKNSCDIRLTIDVMKVMHAKSMDCIVLATSDSDFASLASEIRAYGLMAIGFGESKSREELKNAFTSFEFIGKNIDSEEVNLQNDKQLLNLLRNAIESTTSDTGKSLVSQVGLWLKANYLKTASSYGKDSWGDVLKSMPKYFEISYDGVNNSIMSVRYIGKTYKARGASSKKWY